MIFHPLLFFQFSWSVSLIIHFSYTNIERFTLPVIQILYICSSSFTTNTSYSLFIYLCKIPLLFLNSLHRVSLSSGRLKEALASLKSHSNYLVCKLIWPYFRSTILFPKQSQMKTETNQCLKEAYTPVTEIRPKNKINTWLCRILNAEKRYKARKGKVIGSRLMGEGVLFYFAFFSLGFLSSSIFPNAWFWIECQIAYEKLVKEFEALILIPVKAAWFSCSSDWSTRWPFRLWTKASARLQLQF